jgi:hypothetical protein
MYPPTIESVPDMEMVKVERQRLSSSPRRPDRSNHPDPGEYSVRPEVSEVDDSKPRVEGELTDALIEDELSHGDSEGEAGDDGDAQR